MHRALFVPSFPLEKSLCILNLTVPSSFANLVVVFVVVSCIATAHSNSVGGVSGGYTHCSSAKSLWPLQWVDVPMGSQYSVPIPWPLTAELMSVVSVHGGDDNYDMWPSYNGKTLHSTAKNINGYVIGIFQ
jgi:hypothetical protein